MQDHLYVGSIRLNRCLFCGKPPEDHPRPEKDENDERMEADDDASIGN
jgi:hypothetical protein